MNKVILMGRLTRDPEIRYSQGATPTAIANYSLAVERRFKREGQPDADFFDCTCFGKSAEFVEKYLKKGTKMVVEGRLQNDNYTNKEGQKVYRTRIMVENQEFAESKASAQGQGTAPGTAPAQAAPQQSAPAAQDTGIDMNAMSGFMNIPDGMDDELPFS